MGYVHVEIRLINPADRTRTAQMQLLVDTGARFSVIARTVLESIGITPTRRRKFRLVDGSSIEREVGGAIFEWEGYEGEAPVIFGEAGDASVLGVVSLEAMGLEVDPVSERLRPAELLLL